MFLLVGTNKCSMNVMVFITLHATSNTINIEQMFAIIVLFAFFELDYHVQKLM